MTFRRSELNFTWSRIDDILCGSRAEMLEAAKPLAWHSDA